MDDGKNGRKEEVFAIEILKTNGTNKDKSYQLVSSELR